MHKRMSVILSFLMSIVIMPLQGSDAIIIASLALGLNVEKVEKQYGIRYQKTKEFERLLLVLHEDVKADRALIEDERSDFLLEMADSHESTLMILKSRHYRDEFRFRCAIQDREDTEWLMLSSFITFIKNCKRLDEIDQKYQSVKRADQVWSFAQGKMGPDRVKNDK